MYFTKRASAVIVCALSLAGCAAIAGGGWAYARSMPQPQQPAQNAAKQVIGAIEAINGNMITLKPDTGANVNVTVQGAVRVLRVAPGQTDLKTATPIQLSDLQVGDRILVRGTPSADGQSLSATAIVAMKRSDVEAKQQQEREDWQKRGIGGLVSAVDAGAGTITISVAAAGGTKAVAVHAAQSTIFRRYAPDSVQFDDAKPSSLAEIKAGDQVRARGARNADGTEFAAEEIVSGAFRNIAGTINNVDAAANALTVMDLATKKPVVVKISAQSQLLKLPPQMAQGVAMQLKGGGRGGNGATGSESGRGGEARTGEGGGNGRGAGRGPADLQQMMNRIPKVTLAEMQKGDAVMIVSTEGTTAGGVTAITLLSGVEPILQAPSGQSMTLPPWNLGGGGDEGGGGGEAN
jgi:hypothetical protein